MKYETSYEAIKAYFKKYDNKVMSKSDKYINEENIRIEQDFKKRIEEILQKTDTQESS